MPEITDIHAFLDSPEAEAYVGRDFNKYRLRWLRAYEKYHDIKKIKAVPSLNLLALFLLPVWAGYRKQFGVLFAVTLMISAAVCFEIFSGILIPGVAYISALVAISAMVNGWYFQHMFSFFRKLETEDTEERMAKIKKHGGTSVALAVLMPFVFLAGLLAVYIGATEIATQMGIEVDAP